MKTIIKCADGSVAVMTLSSGSDVLQEIEKWRGTNPEKYISHRNMEDSAIPKDRTFRNAWSDTTPQLTIDVDMVKARKIHLDNIRTKRNFELSKLDIEGIKAQDADDAPTLIKIRDRKQQLRDLPETLNFSIESANSTDELKAIQPFN